MTVAWVGESRPVTPSECMVLLGLGEAASLDEIKRAYRRLAQQLHPDKHGGDDVARRRFVEVSDAYRTLARAAQAVERGKDVGTCRECGQFGEVASGPDGRPRCRGCVFRPVGGRLLPFPVLVVAKCVSTFVLLAAGSYLLTAAISTGRQAYAAGAFLAGLLGLAALAHTCVTVVHCLHPRERTVQRKQRVNRL